MLLSIGHRGAMAHAPENTLASVSLAVALGADGVEIDVHLVEGHLVVIHDDRLERTTNGHGPLSATTFAALRALDAGNGERVPTLDEVLDLVDRRVGVNVELKGAGTAPAVAACLEARLASGWDVDHFLVSSFEHRRLARVRALAPRVKIGALAAGPLGDAVAVATALGAWSVHPPFQLVDAPSVQRARAAGLRVYAYTADEPADIQRLRALGVDGVFTNHPERAADAGGASVRRWR